MFTGQPHLGKTDYSYSDEAGGFRQSRESKVQKNRIITRSQILSTQGSGAKVLEKSIMVSQIGSIRNKKSRLVTVRPVASEFTVWLEGKRYFSQMKIDEKSKSMKVHLESPEKKWTGVKEFKFPNGKYFCFFNQLPECLFNNYLLVKGSKYPNLKLDFFIIWDNYPFIQDLLTRVGGNLFSPASIKFEGEYRGQLRYSVEVDGQTIIYHFSKNYDFKSLAWITQGITIVPPGEEISED